MGGTSSKTDMKNCAVFRIMFLTVVVALLSIGPVLSVESASGEDSLGLAGPGEDFRLTELGPDAVVITSEPFAANSLLVRTESGDIILVDSPATPADTEILLEWSQTYWKGPVTHSVASHWHSDASAGNQVLIGRGAHIVSTRLTASLLQKRGESMKTDLIEMFQESDPATAAEMKEFRPTPAQIQVEIDGRLTIHLGGEEIVLVAPGPSHSLDSIGVFFPRLKLLYGGCAVRSNGRVVNTTDADFDNWTQALETFAALGADIVIPGHGIRFDPAMIQESIEAVSSFRAVAVK